MTNSIESINLSKNSIKQPPPSTIEDNTAQNAKAETYKRPNVGVVSPVGISRTPMADTIEINKQEYPQLKYKFIPKPKITGNFQKLASIATVVLGTLAFILRK